MEEILLHIMQITDSLSEYDFWREASLWMM